MRSPDAARAANGQPVWAGPLARPWSALSSVPSSTPGPGCCRGGQDHSGSQLRARATRRHPDWVSGPSCPSLSDLGLTTAPTVAAEFPQLPGA